MRASAIQCETHLSCSDAVKYYSILHVLVELSTLQFVKTGFKILLTSLQNSLKQILWACSGLKCPGLSGPLWSFPLQKLIPQWQFPKSGSSYQLSVVFYMHLPQISDIAITSLSFGRITCVKIIRRDLGSAIVGRCSAIFTFQNLICTSGEFYWVYSQTKEKHVRVSSSV